MGADSDAGAIKTRRIRLLLAAGACVAALAIGLDPPARAQSPKVARPLFPHRAHLALDFASPRREGDCRACHAFGREGFDAYAEPFETCLGCHQDKGHLLFPPPKPRRGRPFFDHNRHRDTNCLTCHEPRLSPDSAPGDLTFDVPRGLALCSQCHRDHDPAKPPTGRTGKAGRGEACATCHFRKKLRPAGERTRTEFSHRTHLAGTKRPRRAECLACHSKIVVSTRIGDEMHHLAPGGCKKCHHDEQGALAGLKIATRPREPVTFFDFKHSVHAEKVQSCTRCHPLGQDGEPGAGTGLDYETCIMCHGTKRVKNHGAGAACWRCHVTEPKFEQDRMVTVEVKRRRPTGFSFGAHAHPQITIEGRTIGDADCAGCHRARRSKLERKAWTPFTHRSHLPARPRNKDCSLCHASVDRSVTSVATRAFDDRELGRGERCVTCHTGGRMQWRPREVRTLRVAEFDHAAHIASPEIESCATCHDLGKPVPGPQSCKSCHNHGSDPNKPDYSKRTGSVDLAGAIQNCKFCHGRGVARKPQRGPLVREHATIEAGAQFHDKGGTCSACHGFERGPKARIVPRLESLEHKSIHRDPLLREAPFNLPRAEGNDCMRCHRKEPRSLTSER